MTDDIMRKIKGTLQDAKGDIELNSPDIGTKLEGLVDKTKGKLNKIASEDKVDRTDTHTSSW